MKPKKLSFLDRILKEFKAIFGFHWAIELSESMRAPTSTVMKLMLYELE